MSPEQPDLTQEAQSPAEAPTPEATAEVNSTKEQVAFDTLRESKKARNERSASMRAVKDAADAGDQQKLFQEIPNLKEKNKDTKEKLNFARQMMVESGSEDETAKNLVDALEDEQEQVDDKIDALDTKINGDRDNIQDISQKHQELQDKLDSYPPAGMADPHAEKKRQLRQKIHQLDQQSQNIYDKIAGGIQETIDGNFVIANEDVDQAFRAFEDAHPPEGKVDKFKQKVEHATNDTKDALAAASQPLTAEQRTPYTQRAAVTEDSETTYQPSKWEKQLQRPEDKNEQKESLPSEVKNKVYKTLHARDKRNKEVKKLQDIIDGESRKKFKQKNLEKIQEEQQKVEDTLEEFPSFDRNALEEVGITPDQNVELVRLYAQLYSEHDLYTEMIGKIDADFLSSLDQIHELDKDIVAKEHQGREIIGTVSRPASESVAQDVQELEKSRAKLTKGLKEKLQTNQEINLETRQNNIEELRARFEEKYPESLGNKTGRVLARMRKSGGRKKDAALQAVRETVAAANQPLTAEQRTPYTQGGGRTENGQSQPKSTKEEPLEPTPEQTQFNEDLDQAEFQGVLDLRENLISEIENYNNLPAEKQPAALATLLLSVITLVSEGQKFKNKDAFKDKISLLEQELTKLEKQITFNHEGSADSNVDDQIENILIEVARRRQTRNVMDVAKRRIISIIEDNKNSISLPDRLNYSEYLED